MTTPSETSEIGPIAERMSEPGIGLDSCDFCWGDSIYAFGSWLLCPAHAAGVVTGDVLVAPPHPPIEDLAALLAEENAGA